MRRFLLPGLLPLLFLVSCVGQSRREFLVDAINTQEGQLPCVVLIDDEVQHGPESQELRTPARVVIDFKLRSDGIGYQSVKLGVKAVSVDAEGKIVSGLRKGEPSDYHEDFRSVYPADAPRQMFVLHRRRAGS
jgi:hypothetical protein